MRCAAARWARSPTRCSKSAGSIGAICSGAASIQQRDLFVGQLLEAIGVFPVAVRGGRTQHGRCATRELRFEFGKAPALRGVALRLLLAAVKTAAVGVDDHEIGEVAVD